MVTAWSEAKSNRMKFNCDLRLLANMADKAYMQWKVTACQSAPRSPLFLLVLLSLCQYLERYLPWLSCWPKGGRATYADHI